MQVSQLCEVVLHPWNSARKLLRMSLQDLSRLLVLVEWHMVAFERSQEPFFVQNAWFL